MGWIIWGKKLQDIPLTKKPVYIARGFNVERIHSLRKGADLRLEIFDPKCEVVEVVELSADKARKLAELILKTLKTP